MKYILKLLSIIDNEVKIKDITDNLGLQGDELLKLLSEYNIGYIDNEIVRFNKEDRLKLSILALKHGVDIKDIAKVLSWLDFEYLASMILKAHNYIVYNNIRINRLEIDILALDDISIIIDCKHWRYNNLSNLKKAVYKQIMRARLLLNNERFNIKYLMPLIVTLNESILFIDQVPIVPIDKLSNFLDEFKGYMDSLLVISK